MQRLIQWFQRLCAPPGPTVQERVREIDRERRALIYALDDLELRLAVRTERIMRDVAALEGAARRLLVHIDATNDRDAANKLVSLTYATKEENGR